MPIPGGGPCKQKKGGGFGAGEPGVEKRKRANVRSRPGARGGGRTQRQQRKWLRSGAPWGASPGGLIMGGPPMPGGGPCGAQKRRVFQRSLGGGERGGGRARNKEGGEYGEAERTMTYMPGGPGGGPGGRFFGGGASGKTEEIGRSPEGFQDSTERHRSKARKSAKR